MTSRAKRGGRWAVLSTEHRNPRSRRLDQLDTRRVVALLIDEDRRAIAAAGRQSAAIARGATLLAQALGAGGRVLFAGAGTSGRLGVLEAAECPPTFGTRPAQIQAAMAGGPASVFASREGAEDDGDAGARAARGLRRRDVLVGISASSVTPFVHGALSAARRRGAATVLVTCARGVPQRGVADVIVRVDTGPEVLTGSTRLKAGSATKAVLNALTTAAMVRLGKTYENFMVDLRPTSAKLRDRSARIVGALAGVDARAAARLLDESGGEVKTAVAMARLALSADAAREALRGAGGHLRRALAVRKAGRGPGSPRRGPARGRASRGARGAKPGAR